MKKIEFFNLTEIPGDNVPEEQFQRINKRYQLIKQIGANQKILEIACGPGIAAKALNETASKYIGLDIDPRLIDIAKKNNPNIEFINNNFEKIDESFFKEKFDIIFIYEAIYYIKDLKNFFSKVYNLLKKSGFFIICNPNKNLIDFNPSAKSYEYPDLNNIKELIGKNFTIEDCLGDISVKDVSLRQKFLRPLKFFAKKFNLIPNDMRNKTFLKKFFFGGSMLTIPKNIDLELSNDKLKKISNEYIDKEHKVLFFILKKN